MTNVWLKIRIWTKVVVFSVVGIYALLFVVKNWNVTVSRVTIPFVTEYHDSQLLAVLLGTAAISIIAWSLLRTIAKTARQLKDMRGRSRTAKLEKEVAQMRAKAGRLQTREPDAAAPGSKRVVPEDADETEDAD
jgi:hypothetical protein